jgi:hypothetical protein
MTRLTEGLLLNLRRMIALMGETALPPQAVSDVASAPDEWTDESLLRVLGIGMTAAGVLLLAAAGTIMNIQLPLTLEGALGFILSVSFGIVLFAIGIPYILAARDPVSPQLGIEGLSVCTDPDTHGPAWIKIAEIESAVLRPWGLTPWIKSHRFYEIELKVKEGALQVEDTFLVHLNPGFEEFRGAFQDALGNRLEVRGVR